MTAITGTDVDVFRLSVLEKGLKLECLGMKRRGKSCYAVIKEEFGFRGSKAKVLSQFEEYVHNRKEAGVSVDIETKA